MVNKTEFDEIIGDYKLKLADLFTAEIRKSELYRKWKCDSELPEILNELSKVCNEFDGMLRNFPLNVNDMNAEVLIGTLNKKYCKIKKIVNEIDWN